MVTVAFYVDNSAIATRDCTTILDTNPGIGGTEYLFYYTAYSLQLSASNQLDISLLTTRNCKLPNDCINYQVKDIIGAIKFCQSNKIETLVIKYDKKYFKPNIFTHIKDINIIIWAHNVIGTDTLTTIAKSKSIKKIINVGQEQLDLYRDHLAFKKSTYIYNSLTIKPKIFYLEHSIPFAQRKDEITYLGSIVPIKGFHILAKAWPEIIKQHPSAHLNIIGSGSVYGDRKMGKYGIAEENYEKEFINYLTDKQGNLLPSVTFWGNLGEEKSQILSRTKIGIPNPSGKSETFCLSALEMELYGCRIVTKKYVGYLDTVPNSAGILYKNEKELVDIIINELKKNSNPYDITYKYIYDNFRTEKILSQWEQLFLNPEQFTQNNCIKNIDYNYKRIREFNRKLKSILPFGYLLPTVDTYIRLCNKLLRTKIPILY